MTVYRDIYKFNVIEEINSGKSVFVVDKADCYVTKANNVCAEDLIKIVFASNEDNRYSFFVEETKETNE